METNIVDKEEHEPVELYCHNCGYQWRYNGLNNYFATCPKCLRKVSVKGSPHTEEEINDLFKEIIIKALGTWANERVNEMKENGEGGSLIDIVEQLSYFAKENPELARELGEIAYNYYQNSKKR